MLHLLSERNKILAITGLTIATGLIINSLSTAFQANCEKYLGQYWWLALTLFVVFLGVILTRLTTGNSTQTIEPTETQKPFFHSRYLISSEFGILKSLADGKLDLLPIDDCLLHKNAVLSSFQSLFSGQEYRSSQQERPLDCTELDYTSKYPNALVLDGNNEYQYYHHTRIPNLNEALKLSDNDSLINHMLTNGWKIEDTLKVYTCYEGECGGDGRFQELVLYRPLYMKFLVFTNTTNEYLSLKSLNCKSNRKSSNIFSDDSLALPKLEISPGQSVIVPLGMQLADFDDITYELLSSDQRNVQDDDFHFITLNHIKGEGDDFECFGLNYLPLSLTFEVGGIEHIHEFHKFDFSNTYMIDEHWECGSCPHLFFVTNRKALLYQGELFDDEPGITQNHVFTIPQFIESIVIAELEDEVTIIEYIKRNDEIITTNIELEKGESLRIAVSKGDSIEVNGTYIVHFPNNKKLPLVKKRKITESYKSQFAAMEVPTLPNSATMQKQPFS
jgi:hypothetical protein